MTGNWEVRRQQDCFALVDPSGSVNSLWSLDSIGESQAQGYADTYNMNEDREEEFRQCPYCDTACPWCI